MLPEMFCSAKDCAFRPPTEVFNASKIPITLSPQVIRRRGRNSRETSQALCQDGKPCYFNDLNKKPRSNDRGTIAGRATIAGRNGTFQPAESSARLRACCVENEGKSVHAVAQARGLWTVVEDVAEMTTAAAAMHFGADHPEGA